MSGQVAGVDLFEGMGVVEDRVLLLMRDLVGQGLHPAVVIVGMLTGAGTAAVSLVAELDGAPPDDDMALDLAVVTRSAIMASARIAGAFDADPAGFAADPEVQRATSDLMAAQHVIACDLREAFGARAAVHPLASVATVGSA